MTGYDKNPSLPTLKWTNRNNRGREMGVHAVYHSTFGKAVIMDLSRPVVPHIHLDYHIFVPLRGGVSLFTVGGKTHRLSSGQCIGVNPWQPHSYELVDGGAPVLAIVLYLDPYWLTKAVEDCGLKWHQNIGNVAMTPGIERAASQLAVAMMRQRGVITGERCFDSVLEELCLSFIDEDLRSANTHAYREPLRFKVPADFRLRKSLAFMRENIGRRCSLEMVARESGMSRPWFFHCFREQTGVTPNMYWDSLRMDSAFNKLGSDDSSICDVSFDLGFSSQSNFTRFFVNHFNASPSDFRSASARI